MAGVGGMGLTALSLQSLKPRDTCTIGSVIITCILISSAPTGPLLASVANVDSFISLRLLRVGKKGQEHLETEM